MPAEKLPSNPALLEFPTDEFQLTSKMRREALRAIERIRGNPQKEKVFLDTLRLLAAFAKIRATEQRAPKPIKINHGPVAR